MKIFDYFKNLYYALEDKWYEILDKIDEKIPVYKFIDPIDRVIPSFVLFLLLVLFIILLLSYLIRFSSPYEITFIVSDSQTLEKLTGVGISGSINEADFKKVITNTQGKAIVETIGPKNNIFELMSIILFNEKYNFVGELNVQKEGYSSWNNKPVIFEGKVQELTLSKLPEDNIKFSGVATVDLHDKETDQKIIDLTETAYIKYECNNLELPYSPFTIKDADDGAVDGSFYLTKENCDFLLTEVNSPGYEPIGSSINLDSSKQKHKITLEKKAPDEGTANVFVYEKVGNEKKPIPGIRVNFNKNYKEDYSFTNTSGYAETALPTGEYIITINDENYYPITSNANKKIIITKGEIKNIEIELNFLPLHLRGYVYFKVIDSNNQPIESTAVTLIELQKDSNGNIFATNPKSNNTVYTPLVTNLTDSNGLFRQHGFTDANAKVLAIVKKQGYLTKLFLAKIVKYSDPYEIITLEKLDENNTGSATINVKDIDTNENIFQANTFLYYSTTISGFLINNIPLERYGLKTDPKGNADYTFLTPGTYSAGADVDGDYFSGISPTKEIDMNQHEDFNLYLNFKASFLKFKLVDAITGNNLDGFIELYNVGSNNSKQLIELISVKKNNYYEAETALKRTNNLIIVGKVNRYSPTTLYLGGSHAYKEGDNYYTLKLYPNKILDNNNTPDGNGNGGTNRVNIFFEDIYSANDNYWDGNSTADVLEENKKYTAVFKVVLNGTVKYKELLAMARILGPTNLTNSKPGLIGESRIQQNIYDCNTIIFDSSPKIQDDNYYLPNTNCTKTINSKKIQAGFKWGNVELDKGIYTLAIDFSTEPNSMGKVVELNYRAKEKDEIDSTETKLFKEYFTIGEPIRGGVYFKVINGSQTLFVKADSTPKTKDVLLISQSNDTKISVINKTPLDITQATLNTHSYLGTFENFSININNGLIYFGEDKAKSKTLFTNQTILRNNSMESEVKIFAPKESWLVLTLENDTLRKAFIKIKPEGEKLVLNKGVFLAGIENQEYYAEVKPKKGTNPVKIMAAKITVNKNCKNTTKTKANISPNPIIIGPQEANSFSKIIQGIYVYQQDCLDLEIDGINSNGEYYERLLKTVYAGSGGTLDPELRCIEIDLEDSTPNNELDPTLLLEWEGKKDLVVTNKCTGNFSNVLITIDSGLICKIKNSQTECKNIKLPLGEKVTFEIYGKNIDYAPTQPKPNFTDILGSYPVYVKAKFENKSKNYAIAKTAHISLYNPTECFSISKDYFDFTESNQPIPFAINNACQYTLIGDYFVPKTNLQAFGYSLNSEKPEYTFVNISPKLLILGADYLSRTVEKVIEYPGNTYTMPKDYFKIQGQENYDLNIPLNYSNLRLNLFDTNAEIRKIEINFVDINYSLFAENMGVEIVQGFSLTGKIKAIYEDNSEVLVQPSVNFDINSFYPVCTYQDPLTPGEECIILNALDDPTANPVGTRETSMSGYLTIVLPENSKKIKYLDFNLSGTCWREEFELKFIPYLKSKMNVEEYYLNNNEVSKEINLGINYQIPAIEGMEFVIKSVNEISAFRGNDFISISNPKIYLNSGNPLVSVWIEGNLLKAKFIGTDYEGFNDQEVPLELVKEFGEGINYGIIEITDYVIPTSGKKISGVN